MPEGAGEAPHGVGEQVLVELGPVEVTDQAVGVGGVEPLRRSGASEATRAARPRLLLARAALPYLSRRKSRHSRTASGW